MSVPRGSTVDHDAPCLPLKILLNHCLRFLLGELLARYRGETGNNDYAKWFFFDGGGGRGKVNKVHSGLCENGEYVYIGEKRETICYLFFCNS